MNDDTGAGADRGSEREDLVTQSFVALADMLVDDYDIVDLLDRLVHICVELLGVSQAGLMLIDQRGDQHLMASSSEATRLGTLPAGAPAGTSVHVSWGRRSCRPPGPPSVGSHGRVVSSQR